MLNLIAVRHAEVIETGICYGRLEMETEAKEGAREHLHSELKRLVAARCCTLWTSPSGRCLREALAVGNALKLIPQIDQRLYEIAFGAWEGAKWSDLESKDEFKVWMANWQEAAPPGGESLGKLAKRVGEWLVQLPSDSVHIVITHAGVIRQLHVRLGSLDWPAAMRLPVPHLTPIAWNLSASK